MDGDITINARRDGEAKVWLATNEDVPGLVVEGETWPAMIRETRAVLPDLLELQGAAASRLSLTFRAEEHLDLAGAGLSQAF